MAYIEGSNAVAPGDPIGLRINGGSCEDAVVAEISRFRMTVETSEQRLEIDLRPCNEATWDKARQYIAEQAGAGV